MRDYELMVVLDPDLDEAAVQAAVTKVTSFVTARGGEVRSVQEWGRRQLAYPIGKFRAGIYVLLRLALRSEQASELERSLTLTESVMRHLLVRVEEPVPAGARA